MEASVIALGTNVSKTGLSSGLKMSCLQGTVAAVQIYAGVGLTLQRRFTYTSFLVVFQRSSNTVLFSYYFHCPIYNFIERHYTKGKDRLTWSGGTGP